MNLKKTIKEGNNTSLEDCAKTLLLVCTHVNKD